MIKDSRAYRYARWCVEPDNKYVGVYVRKQAEKWLAIADDKRPDICISLEKWEKITRLLKLMIHPDLSVTMLDGLEDYALFFIYAVFCTVRRSDGLRYYQTALLEIARKNFKTFTSAVIFIIGLLTEPRFSRFFSVAPDLSLSSELQIAIKKIIKSSPYLNDEKIFKLLRKEIRCKLTDSEYTPLAYSQDRLDGKICNMFLADECGAMDSYPIEAMRSSQITLHEKLGIIISTQYPKDSNAMLDEIDTAKKTLDDILYNRIFALLYEPDECFRKSGLWKTEDSAIYQANPAACSNRYIFDDIVQKRQMAILYKNKRENFLCKHLNIMYKGLGAESYIDIDRIKDCRIAENPDFWRGRYVYFGLDLSQTTDNTALAMVTYADGIIYSKIWGFIPKDRIKIKSESESVDYNRLIDDGCCFACGDEVIDYNFVEDFILSLSGKLGVIPVQLGFDRYNAISTVQKLENAENPIECVEIKQHSSVLHRPTKLLKEYVLSGKFSYETNQMLEINFQNAQCTYDTNLNLYVNKKRSNGKVDMVVALINAVYLLQIGELDAITEDFGCILI